MSSSLDEKQPIDIQGFFESAGKLSEIIDGYIERPEQTAVAVIIDEALNIFNSKYIFDSQILSSPS